MIQEIKPYTEFRATCDVCGKHFAYGYPTHRSLVVALLAMDWEVDDDYEYIHCPECAASSTEVSNPNPKSE